MYGHYYFDRLEDAIDAEHVVWIGYDPLEDQCAKMLAHSIRSRTTMDDLKIIPIVRDELLAHGLFERPIDPRGSTQFSLTRFMVPALMGFTGVGIFFDCDMLVTRDISEMFDLYDPTYAVQCVQHDYAPKADPKMGGKPQTTYPRKNWSSTVIYNAAHPSNSTLTKKHVEQASPKYLHRFEWLKDSEIGSLPIEFNFLVEEYEMAEELPFNLHHTLGPPIYAEKVNADYHQQWKAEFAATFGREFDPVRDVIF